MKIRLTLILLTTLNIICFKNQSQESTKKWTAQIGLGLNSPANSGFVTGYEAKSINLPTVNLGIQHFFKPQLGARLDYGFNRFKNDDTSSEFKTNYSRINVQFVYNPTKSLGFLPERGSILLHAGPGYSFVRAIGTNSGNKTSFFNVMGGIEISYAIDRYISLYADVSYIAGLGKELEFLPENFGLFNGSLTTITFGISFALSGCQYC